MADIQQIKELMAKYDQAHRAGLQAAILRKQLIPLLKNADLTKTKFNFGDRTINFHSYNDYENITQQLIKSVVKEKYPNVNAECLIGDIRAARKYKKIETLRVQRKTSN